MQVPPDPCRLLEWDTAHWGIPIARVNGDHLDPAGVPAIDAWCAARSVACLTLLLGCDDRDSAAAAHAAGFFPADVRLTFSRPLSGVVPMDRCPVARLARQHDLPALRALAAASHEDTRFFFDTRFPRAHARDLYARWIERDLADPAGAVFVADGTDGALAGYLSVAVSPAAVGGEARISLLAVDPGARRRGVARCLLASALAWSAERGAAEAMVVTQARNVAAQAFYQRAGFAVAFCEVWLHRWSAAPESSPP